MIDKQTRLDWLIKLAQEPGWKLYAWQEAKRLDKVDGFNGIAQDLERSMQRLKEGQAKAGG